MILERHSECRVQKLNIGAEQAPLIVIDNFIENAEALVLAAKSKAFVVTNRFFPGIRAKAPLQYQHFLLAELKDTLVEHFNLPEGKMSFSMCHYSLVTTPAEKLAMIQRIPHIDSTEANGLATVHYLFKGSLGGTAFYRHRKTGFEYIDESRQLDYFRSLEDENDGPNMPGSEYINGDTPLFERIAAQEGVFNRMLIYRRNSLHSGSIDANFQPDPNPLTGRLSINSFIDLKS